MMIPINSLLNRNIRDPAWFFTATFRLLYPEFLLDFSTSWRLLATVAFLVVIINSVVVVVVIGSVVVVEDRGRFLFIGNNDVEFIGIAVLECVGWIINGLVTNIHNTSFQNEKHFITIRNILICMKYLTVKTDSWLLLSGLTSIHSSILFPIHISI